MCFFAYLHLTWRYLLKMFICPSKLSWVNQVGSFTCESPPSSHTVSVWYMDRTDPKTVNHQAFLQKNLWNGTLLALGGSKYTSTVTARLTPCSLSFGGIQENKLQMPRHYFPTTTWSLREPPPKFNCSPLKSYLPNRKGSSSSPAIFQGQAVELQGSMYFKNPRVLQYSLNFAPSTQLGS